MSNAAHEVAARLKREFAGDILLPHPPDSAGARAIWTAMVAKTPAVILRPASVSDVQSAVRACVAEGALTAIRCGGHSLAGFSTCDGGVVLDLSRLRHVSVDPSARIANAAGGCLLGTIDAATQQAGLAFPAGVVSHTGASGLILGGGTGWLTRLCGLSCDNVAAFTLVNAEGAILRANARENPDLYWALRGGGGNFGVVTEFELRLHPVSHALIASALSLEHDIRPVLRFWRDFMPAASDALKWNISIVPAPASPAVPTHLQGAPALSQTLLWFGDEGEGERVIDRVLTVGRPINVSRRPLSFLALQTMADHEFPHGDRYYTKSGYFQELRDEAIDIMVEAMRSIPSPKSQVELAYLGGAAGRVPADATAFGSRSAPFIMNLLAQWSDPAEDAANVAWVRGLFHALRPYMQPGVYVNFMSADETDRVAEAYSARWDRLVQIKKKFDPTNFFRLNQNIKVDSQTNASGA